MKVRIQRQEGDTFMVMGVRTRHGEGKTQTRRKVPRSGLRAAVQQMGHEIKGPFEQARLPTV